MTDFRVRIVITLSYFALGLFLLPTAAHPEELSLRRAATPSSTESVRPYRSAAPEEMGQAGRKTRIGLSPVPYRPEHPDTHTGGPVMRQNQFPDMRNLIKKINRSVVSIRMLDAGSKFSLGKLGFAGDPGNKAMGYGSGFVVSANGHIMTNEHVLRNGSVIEVELLGGHKYVAQVVSKDKKNDLALLKIDATNLLPVKLGDSDNVELGEWVVGIGNPYGIGQSVMMGIVSAQRRQIPGSGYPPLIQIDAAMNLGNSGGPLFNMDGEVVGINTILLWKSQGIGFATPANVAREFLETRSSAWMKAAASASAGEVGGPAAPNTAHAAPESFNPLDPPWKFGP
jgi:S1-C subfamily serine protease